MRAVPQLLVGGLVPLTTLDFPGRLAAVVFSQGCSWRCRYCHNTHLIPRESDAAIPWEQVRGFLERRRGLLDGVVFSGGEPTLQAGLEQAMIETIALGFEVGLHTAGTYPQRLARLLPLLDWVALDVKAPFEDYDRVTGVAGSGSRVRQSIELLVAAGVEFECRTTVQSQLLGEDETLALADELARMGVRHYALQAFRPEGCADPELAADGAAFRALAAWVGQARGGAFARFEVRES